MENVEQHESGCVCADCQAFNRWVDDTNARWARAYAAGKVAHLPCDNPLCVLHADERDTSYDRARLGVPS